MKQPLLGKRSRCPLCASLLSADADALFGQTHCPRCMTGLWFVNFPTGGTRFIVRTKVPVEELLAALVRPAAPDLARHLPALLHDGELDSLDVVELLAEIEAALPRLSD
jgi:hypothetical protein